MFNLVRHFSIVSFVLIGLAVGLLTVYFRSITLEQLVHHEKTRAEEFTRVFENSLWPQFRHIVNAPPTNTDTALSKELRETLTRMTHGTNLIQIKVYTLQGLNVFSTDPSQIGENGASKTGFVSASQGTSSSTLTHHKQFEAIEGALLERDVITAHVSLHNRSVGQERIEAVFEVSLDATRLVQRVDRQLQWVFFTVLAMLGSLYLVQCVLVRRAHTVLRGQARTMEHSNLALDLRVDERTRQLKNEITERRLIERQLHHLAHHDPLTELPNRLHIREHLTLSLQNNHEASTQLAALFIGLDHFKEVNQTLGHTVGDELLAAVSRRLQSRLRAGDDLARLGSDEFFCILENIQNPEEVAHEANKLLTLFQQPFSVGENQVFLSASIGISLAPQDANETAALVRNANAALYKAKAQGRNRFHFYTPEMTSSARERLHMAGLLRQSILANELRVFWQPKVNPHNHQLCGAEALLRWTSREIGTVPPSHFIPLAEEIGFIVDLGSWVLRETCQQMVTWDVAGFRIPRVSVNLSVKQLERGDFARVLRDILDESGLDPDRLELEITESVIMEVDNANAILAELREMGVHFSIDDFGTGYSSLAYLKNLPVQTLKIDRAFVIGIGKHTSDEAIIEAILKIASSLSLQSVAEGVETEAQLAFLRQKGCDLIQGYYYSPPVSSKGFFDRWTGQLAHVDASVVRQFPTRSLARS